MSTPPYVRTSPPIEPHEIAESQRNWDGRERKKREDEIRAPVEKKLAQAEKVIWNVRTILDRVLANVHVAIGARTLAEELDRVLPAKAASSSDGADRAQLLNSFSMEELRAEIEQRTIAHLTTDARVGDVSCNRLVADAGLTLNPCPSCRQAWCQTGGGKYWVRCQCSTIRQVSGSSMARVVDAWNEVVDAIASSSEKSS